MPRKKPGFTVDVRDVIALRDRLLKNNPAFRKAWESAIPEFGAHMIYSAVLEFGHTFNYPAKAAPSVRAARALARRGGRPVASHILVKRLPNKTIVEVKGRPHIIPAVEKNKRWIVDQLKTEVLGTWGKVVNAKTGRTSVPSKKAVERIWLQILNDKPRRDAVAKAPYLFGFHRRSIAGRAKVLTNAEIESMRKQAQRGRRR